MHGNSGPDKGENIDRLDELRQPAYRRPRFSRRIHSKSQPSGSLSIGSETPDTERYSDEEDVEQELSVRLMAEGTNGC